MTYEIWMGVCAPIWCYLNSYNILYGRYFQDNAEAKGNCLHDHNSTCAFEVQTAPIRDGVLPGVIRQIVIESVFSYHQL